MKDRFDLKTTYRVTKKHPNVLRDLQKIADSLSGRKRNYVMEQAFVEYIKKHKK
jgi:predicted transcriptional regulator